MFVDSRTQTVESDLDYRLTRVFKLFSRVHDHFGGLVTIGTGSIKRTLELNGEKWTDDTIREKWLEVTSKSLETIDNSRSEDSDTKVYFDRIASLDYLLAYLHGTRLLTVEYSNNEYKFWE